LKRVTVRVLPPDADNDGYHVHLPTYAMVGGSEVLDGQGRLVKVDVFVPDDECDESGALDKAKIRAKYRGQPRWDREDILEDV